VKQTRLLGLLLAGILLAPNSEAGAIYGGTSALNDPLVVGFVENRDSKTTICSGALISSRVAVSVAHCFLNRPNLLAITPGSKASMERDVFRISKVIFVPGYLTDCGEQNNQDDRYRCSVKDDFVFVLFEKDVIANYQIEIANKDDVELIKSQKSPLTLYGYGFTSSVRDLTGEPKKFNSFARMKSGPPDYLQSWFDLLPSEEKVLIFTEELKNSVCTGDSGGPVYSGKKIVSVINSGNGCGPTEVARGGQSTLIYQYMYLLEEAQVKAAEAELKAKQEADAKAAAELKAKQEADAKAAAELKAKQEADAKAAANKAAAELKAKQEAKAKAAAVKKMTITCVKGKLTKKVTAVKPKCPSGYKVKK
jgi:hypothetical protein